MGGLATQAGDGQPFFDTSLSSSYVYELSQFTVNYGLGFMSVDRVSDKVGSPGQSMSIWDVCLAYLLTLLMTDQMTIEFGVIYNSSDFFSSITPYSGILGLAYQVLASVCALD